MEIGRLTTDIMVFLILALLSLRAAGVIKTKPIPILDRPSTKIVIYGSLIVLAIYIIFDIVNPELFKGN